MLSIPILVKDRFVGAATLERPPGEPFDQAAVDLAEAVVAILGPALLESCRRRQVLVNRTGDECRGKIYDDRHQHEDAIAAVQEHGLRCDVGAHCFVAE